MPGTTYYNYLEKVTEDGRKPVPVSVYQISQNTIDHS